MPRPLNALSDPSRASLGALAIDDPSQRRRAADAFLLKACVFATGLAGIVAEYVMSTMASYLLGDAVVQWALTISLMLFAMGLGSRLSRRIRSAVLDWFVTAELLLSLLCGTSAALVFTASAWIASMTPFLYSISFAIGLLIGIEIPLVTRLNHVFEELRVNISSVMEKDYYGALLGGLFFAFVALPYLGLTYTPIVLGAVNLAVAFLLFFRHRSVLTFRRSLALGFAVVPLALLFVGLFAEPIVLFGEQRRYRDRIVYHEQTQYQRIVMTRWKNDTWLYLNGNEQFSSYDEELYHEPLVHPAMLVVPEAKNVLILGGGDGLALREVLKHPSVKQVTLVDIDPAMTRLGRENDILVELNGGSLLDPRVVIANEDALTWLERASGIWDVMLIDLPDPKTADLARLYSLELYQLASRHLAPGGALVTQATSSFFTKRAFLSILATVRASGLVAVPYHNHVPTLGEWAWVIGVKGPSRQGSTEPLAADTLKARLAELEFGSLDTRFLNKDAMVSMLHFGKGFDDEVEVSDHSNLVVFYYYREGDWDLY